jgi:hypothetical protein
VQLCVVFVCVFSTGEEGRETAWKMFSIRESLENDDDDDNNNNNENDKMMKFEAR